MFPAPRLPGDEISGGPGVGANDMLSTTTSPDWKKKLTINRVGKRDATNVQLIK